MAAKQHPQYSQETKDEAIRLMESSDKSISEIATEMNVGVGTLNYWKKQTRKESEPTPIRTNNHQPAMNLDEEVRQLRFENRVLREEKEALRKTIGILAQSR